MNRGIYGSLKDILRNTYNKDQGITFVKLSIFLECYKKKGLTICLQSLRTVILRTTILNYIY